MVCMMLIQNMEKFYTFKALNNSEVENYYLHNIFSAS
jgi:hypothetical protein